eukprot:1179145-Prorocentrum_minimum.AAC.1
MVPGSTHMVTGLGYGPNSGGRAADPSAGPAAHLQAGGVHPLRAEDPHQPGQRQRQAGAPAPPQWPADRPPRGGLRGGYPRGEHLDHSRHHRRAAARARAGGGGAAASGGGP